MSRVPLSALRAVVFLLLAGAVVAISVRWISLERWRYRALNEESADDLDLSRLGNGPESSPTPTRAPIIAGKLETARLFNGITVRTIVETPEGGSATAERKDPESYVLDLKLLARLPKANQTIEELTEVSPSLPQLLPDLPKMIGAHAVSPFYTTLYQTKLQRLRDRLTRLDTLLSRHNFYDCQTILRLQHPETKRRAVLIQAEMDVDADGSDSDRVPAGTGAPPNFQPFTSYRWKKKSDRPNPYLSVTEEKLRRYESELEASTTATARKSELKGAIKRARDEINSLKNYSYLIGGTDPFIVIPGGLTASEQTKVGDYAVVIYQDKIYPALVGDIGPTDKAGEASLRIAKEINGAATPLNRPESDLEVTYLIFPDTGERPWGPPDLERIYARCEELVKEIGGAGVALHKWENIIPPIPTPTPTASPTPSAAESPAGAPSVPPAENASPTASPGATFAFPTPTPASISQPSRSETSSPNAGASPLGEQSPSPTATPTVPAKRSPAATPTASESSPQKNSPTPAKKRSGAK